MSLLQLNDAALSVHTLMVLYEMTQNAEKRCSNEENSIFNIEKKTDISTNLVLNKCLILHLLSHFHVCAFIHSVIT